MTQPLFTYIQKSSQQCHDDYLRTIANGLRLVAGIPNPNIGAGSDYDLKATAIGNEAAAIHANAVIKADAHMPDTATGDDLDRWLTAYGLSRRGAVGSHGNVTLNISAASTSIPTNAQLTDTAGLRYQVSIGGTYGPGAQVPVQAIDVGAATNHANGDRLQWATPPPFSDEFATVGALGGTDTLFDGADSEIGNDEPARQRLLAKMANAPGGGNWSQIVDWAQKSNPAVQSAFDFPALLGPSTDYFCVAAAPQTTGPFGIKSKNRDVSATVVASLVVPYVQGLATERAYVVGGTVTNQPVDVAVGLALPPAPTASPAGPGGGWLDGQPWPQPIGAVGSQTPVTVAAVTSTLQFTLNATTAPTAFVSRIAWLSPFEWKLYSSTVIGVSGGSGAYLITLDTPMPGIATGGIIFPQSARQQAYVDALLAAFGALGPGEWTSNLTVKARAFRHPTPALAWPSNLTAVQLRAVENTGPEVEATEWIYRSATSPAVPGAIPTPASGIATSNTPSILVPRNVGFYPAQAT